MKKAMHEEAGMYFISLALYHLVVIFRSVKSTSNFRNPFFRGQDSPHSLRGHFKDIPRGFQLQERPFFGEDESLRAVLSPPAGYMRT